MSITIDNNLILANPGSDEAVALGCTCPVKDNRRGNGLPDGLFWISAECPLHGLKSGERDGGNKSE